MRGVLERHSGAKVWACDETPVFYDLVNKSTYDKKGKKEIKIRTTGADKKMVTVIPVASSDGDKKPITIIFKGKGKAKEDKNLVNRDDCTVLFSDNGWLNTPTSVQFLHSNFTREDNSEQILVWDSYRCQYIIEERRCSLNLVNVIIPRGCTKVIQTCDVFWNSPLKAHLRTLWDGWIQNEEKSFTKNGNIRSISKTQLVDNIVKAWDMISKDVIIKSFRICDQVKDVRPDKILCMKQGKPCEDGLGEVTRVTSLLYTSGRP